MIQFKASILNFTVCRRLLKSVESLQILANECIIYLTGDFKAFFKTVFLPFFQSQRKRQTACG